MIFLPCAALTRGVRKKNPYTNKVDDHSDLYEDERLRIVEQKLIHEQRVICEL